MPRHWVAEWKENLRGFDVRFVLLQPQLEAAKRRNTDRDIWTVDERIIEDLHRQLGEGNTEEGGWLVVDNTHQTVEETVDAILAALQKSGSPT